MNIVDITRQLDKQSAGKRPLSSSHAIWYFLLAGLAMRFCATGFLTWLHDLGLTTYEAFIVAFTVPLAVLFALAFGFVQHESVPITRKALAARFRLRKLTKRDVFWLGLSLVIMFGIGILLSPTQSWILTQLPALQPGEHFPVIMNPVLQNANFPAVFAAWLGGNVVGHWELVVLALIFFFFNIVGEELFWRGTLLPRQEMANGRYAWLVHGLMWHLFHLFLYPWYIISGLPMALAISFVAQKTDNTWTSIVLHGLANTFLLMMVTGAVMGVI